jgi:formate hydrogenlyase transcriptional activator
MTRMSTGGELPDNEPDRLDALRWYDILDTSPDPAFDCITAISAALFRVPIALISFVDHDRIWFKSRHGLEASETKRELGLCGSAILTSSVYHLRDAARDERAWGNSLVAGGLGVRFYAAAPVRTRDGLNLGTLCVMDRKPRRILAPETELLAKLAALVMNQLELRRADREVVVSEEVQRQIREDLHRTEEALGQSEERFRDLFDEAPIAYVHEGIDSRIIRANRTAMKILGIGPEDVPGILGVSLVPDSPDAQRRVHDAIESVGSGIHTNGVELELRRKDNGKPVWVQWWSRPAAGGNYTRTMFVDITERVLLEREQELLQAHNAYLMEEIRTEQRFGDLIGRSPGLRKVAQQIELVAPTDAAVLISGESGTGKELVARAIHERSPRKNHRLVKVNCSAVPESLFESEFFGHVKGAFTGAHKDRPGRFELADGGTLFLDEVGEMPLAMQAKLLRVLQEQELERVGDTRTRKVNVRVIAATNLNPKNAVDAGRLRQDLFYRLGVFPIDLPPLRERRDDIAPLVAHFVTQIAQRTGRPTSRVTQAALRQLTDYDWPCNVRELQNAVERAIIVAQGHTLSFDIANKTHEILTGSAPAVKPAVLTREAIMRQERDNIAHALEQTGGRIFGPKGAAALLGMKPTTLASRITALRLGRPARVLPD